MGLLYEMVIKKRRSAQILHQLNSMTNRSDSNTLIKAKGLISEVDDKRSVQLHQNKINTSLEASINGVF